ncbi:hypothetical protein ILUMI_00934 [Ignelater luminosus]|uniref:Uncharacterized protein n=1 Tax=Ignelater luminosus TaxID=2038154 RepID=A0A8K0DRQ1_IGNLU|nr:hypothetical protein ILUMI_00934 [Ignelater luminosus]
MLPKILFSRFLSSRFVQCAIVTTIYKLLSPHSTSSQQDWPSEEPMIAQDSRRDLLSKQQSEVHRPPHRARANALAVKRNAKVDKAIMLTQLQHIERINRSERITLRDQDDREPPMLQASSSEEVRKFIKAAQVKRVPGTDGITNRTLKALANKAIPALTE